MIHGYPVNTDRDPYRLNKYERKIYARGYWWFPNSKLYPKSLRHKIEGGTKFDSFYPNQGQ